MTPELFRSLRRFDPVRFAASIRFRWLSAFSARSLQAHYSSLDNVSL
jgi:hypothetical protein